MFYPFFINALISVAVIAIAAAIVGTYVMSRRRMFIAGGVTHACFGGLGLGYFLGISPVATAAVFAVGGSLGVEWMSRRGVRNDSAIAVVWAVGMALGILFISLSEGYVPELNSFLFGNVLTVTTADIVAFVIFTSVLIAFYTLFYRRILAISFDEAFARTRHLPVTFVDTVMTVFIALAIVLTIRMIGIMLLMSLISIPQISAELLTRRYLNLMIMSAIISLICSVGGLFIACYIAVPASAAIVLLMTAVYILLKVTVSLSRRSNKSPGR